MHAICKISLQKGKHPPAYLPLIGALLLVEMVGVEPTSENRSTQLSTGVFSLLRFPRVPAGQQADTVGSSLFHVRAEASTLCTCTAKMTPWHRAAVLPGRMQAYLRSLEFKIIVVVYFEKVCKF